MKKNSIHAYYFVLLIAITVTVGFFPVSNGDIPFYTACVLQKQGVPDTLLWAQTKAVLKAELPAHDFEIHARHIDQAKPGIMNFYHSKPLYIWIISGIHHLGLSYTFSIFLPSLISYFFMGLLLFQWVATIMRPLPALLFGLLCLLMGPVAIAARLSSPDALSNLVVFALLYCLYFEKSRISIFLLMLIAVLVRMDNVISVLVLLTAMKFWPVKGSSCRLGVKTYIAGTAALIMLTAGLNFFLEDDFWWILHATYFSSGRDYLRQWQLYGIEFSNSFLLILFLFFLIIRQGKKVDINEKNIYMLLIIFAIIVVRGLLFPALEERFFVAYYLTSLLMLADIVSGRQLVHLSEK